MGRNCLVFFVIQSLNNCLQAPWRWFLHKPVWDGQLFSANPLNISFVSLGILWFWLFCCLSSLFFPLCTVDSESGSLFFFFELSMCPRKFIIPQRLANSLSVKQFQTEYSSVHAVSSLRHTLQSCMVTANTLLWPVYNCHSGGCQNSASRKERPWTWELHMSISEDPLPLKTEKK